jgi:putative transcriptional regulator
MTPQHHVPEDALCEYTAGAASEPAALAIACHIALCAACAARARALEAVAGNLLDEQAGAELAAGALESMLARLDAPPEPKQVAAAQVPAAPAFLASAELPRPLLRALGASKPAADWRMVIPGVRAVDVAIDASAGAPDATVRVIAFKGGVTIPLHDHGGPEHIVVFTGALEEKGRRFARGDISIRNSGERHEQRAAAGEPCIALVVNEGKLQPLTLRGRLLLALSRR